MMVWLNTLPDTFVRTHPFLCVYHAVVLAYTNQLEAAEERLQAAERGIQELPVEQARTIRGYVLAIRAAIAIFTGNIMHGVFLARQALELLPEAEAGPRTGALTITLRVYLVSGDVTPESERKVAVTVQT